MTQWGAVAAAVGVDGEVGVVDAVDTVGTGVRKHLQMRQHR